MERRKCDIAEYWHYPMMCRPAGLCMTENFVYLRILKTIVLEVVENRSR